MTLRTLRHAIEAVAAHAAWRLFAALPVAWASAIGGGVAGFVGPRLRISDVARHNLRLAFPDKSNAEIEGILGEVWDNLGRVVTEFPHLQTIAAERLEIIGAEHIAALRDDGKPGILVSGHYGGWELSGPVALRAGLPVHVVYRAANNPWVETLFRKGRGIAAEGFVPKGAKGARKAIEVLKAGGHLGMLIDQKMNDGIPVPFMGRDAMTAPAVAQFALKFRCPVVPGRIERLPGARFRVTIEPPVPLPDTGNRHQDVHDLMATLNATVERWVRENPGQWLWLHRRWPRSEAAELR